METDNSDCHVIVIAAGSSRRIDNLTREKPKCFLDINGKSMIDYTLDLLNDRGFKRITFVIGYQKDCWREIGDKYKDLSIDYVVSDSYETTGHGFSTYLSREAWETEKKDVLFIHSDIFYDPRLLDQVLDSKQDDVVLVDEGFESLTGDEAVMLGNDGVLTGFRSGARKEDPDSAGEIIGINKWSSELMQEFYSYMEKYFEKNGNNHNYEPVLSYFIRDTGRRINYIESGGLNWMNVNYESDYERAKELHNSVY